MALAEGLTAFDYPRNFENWLEPHISDSRLLSSTLKLFNLKFKLPPAPVQWFRASG